MGGPGTADHLRGQARALQRAVRAGDAAAVERVREVDPSLLSSPFRLSTAQLVVAREYGLPSWARLKQHVENVALGQAAKRFLVVVEQGDRAAVDRYVTDHPDAVKEARVLFPKLITNAVRLGHREIVRRLAELGFDVNATRARFISEEFGKLTALHYAAMRGDVELVRLLLSLRADPRIEDVFGKTALAQARDAE
jgi:hypothetical protein